VRRIAVLAAMPQEVAELQRLLVPDASASLPAAPTRASRDFLAGTLWDIPVVLTWTHWGKVAAAITTTHLLASYDISEVIFTGVAGGLSRGVAIGDVVVADTLIQHDIDASPLFPRHQIPLLGRDTLESDERVYEGLAAAARRFLAADLATAAPAARQRFGIHDPHVHLGQIASGDQFISDPAAAEELRGRLPAALCVEMEGAAAAQVCHDHAVPFGAVRIISDGADDSAPADFTAFLADVASSYTAGILRRYLSGRG
jgi:adenosylhomocysteine nucleosidase